MYGSYWNRVLRQWGSRRLDEPTPSDIKQLAEHVRTHTVPRRNASGGRNASEHPIATLRCPYNQAVADGHPVEGDNSARKVAKPGRLPGTRRAVPDTRLADINRVVGSTGNDPVLDTLLLRPQIETACRRGGALVLRPADLDPDQCLILLHEEGGTVRWQSVGFVEQVFMRTAGAGRRCWVGWFGSPRRWFGQDSCRSREPDAGQEQQ